MIRPAWLRRGRRPTKSDEDPFAAYRSVDGPSLAGGPRVVHDPALDGDPRVVVLLPHLDVGRMSGGPNTVFQLAVRLLPEHRLRFVSMSGAIAPDPEAVLAHVASVTGLDVPPEAIDLVSAGRGHPELAVGEGDVFVATYWPTAHVARAALEVTRAPEFIYVIQDYEAAFYPWSSRFALAQATYSMPIRAIVNEPLLETFLRAAAIGRFADDGLRRTTFTPAVDRTVFAPQPVPEGGRPRRLVFYARPANPRNLFEIGLRVLRMAVGRGLFAGQPWELLAIGQEVPDLDLGAGLVLRGQPWLPYPRYGQLLGSSDVLLSLMLSPHTSYPPLEMAVAGGLVVTNTFGPKTAAALAAISSSILAAAPEVDPLVDRLAEAIAAIPTSAQARPVDDPATPDRAPSLPPTWDAAVGDAVAWLGRQVAELRTP